MCSVRRCHSWCSLKSAVHIITGWQIFQLLSAQRADSPPKTGAGWNLFGATEGLLVVGWWTVWLWLVSGIMLQTGTWVMSVWQRLVLAECLTSGTLLCMQRVVHFSHILFPRNTGTHHLLISTSFSMKLTLSGDTVN
jgi:hypothetical protein